MQKIWLRRAAWGLLASFYLSILVAVTVAQGGLFVAIDVTAGEKERGTLESLLVTPASDIAVFPWALGAVFTISVIPLVPRSPRMGGEYVMPPNMRGIAGYRDSCSRHR